jgi:hypothetical protein
MFASPQNPPLHHYRMLAMIAANAVSIRLIGSVIR